MRLHVEDELPREALRPRARQLRLARFGGGDLEHVASVDLVHGQEGCGHAAAGLHELPAAEAQPLAVVVWEFEDAPFDALLRLALWRREVFAVRYDLGRDRGCG